MRAIVVSRIITVWLVVLILLTIVAPTNEFYRFGPNENLKILGFHVDTPGKYILLLIYSVMSTIIRSLKNNVIQSWITLNIQDESKSLVGLNKLHAYEISLVTEIYGWVDWFINLNMFLAQVDMIIMLTFCETIMVFYITRYYLSIAERQPSKPLFDAKDVEINGI
jgi:hypothetical protein